MKYHQRISLISVTRKVMWRISSVLILLIYIIFTIDYNCADKKFKDDSEFVPTHEWQVVPKGQAIPKGLHVRINFETGITEAKLLDEEEPSQKTDLSLLDNPPNEKEKSKKLLETDVIKEALKKIRSDELASKESNRDKNKFRSYQQLKDELADLNLTTRIDAEILDDLFTQHNIEISKKKLDIGTVVRILEDFDFLAHQFDNGLEFVRQNGFEKIIYKNLNSSSEEIIENTLKLFGSLVQNNGKVQIHALETGGISMILRMLNFQSNSQVKSSAIFALSCLLRRFPLAQQNFIENGGLPVIMKLLKNSPMKIQVRLVTLMNDLLLENIHVVEDTSEENKMLVNQYELIKLEKLLLENDWCNYLNKLIISVLATEPSDHDSVEKCLIPMKTLARQCNNQFSKDILITLMNNYKILADNDRKQPEPDNAVDFFINIHELCIDILHSKNIKNEL